MCVYIYIKRNSVLERITGNVISAAFKVIFTIDGSTKVTGK